MKGRITPVLGALVVLAAAAAAAAGWARRRLVVVVVDGASMTPSFHDGDRLLVRRVTGGIRPGQIVVFGPPIVADDPDPPPPAPPPVAVWPTGLPPPGQPGPTRPPGPAGAGPPGLVGAGPPGSSRAGLVAGPSGAGPVTGRMWLVKRVAAVAGAEVPVGLRGVTGADRVPAGHFLVLGDNPAESHDSRHEGFIPHARIRGVVIRRIGV